MPTGTPFKALVPPYPIRVDDFSAPSDLREHVALHLLTHTHTDHLTGLSARSFSSKVVCSADAKGLLLRHEVYAERVLKDMDVRAENIRTFAHLQVKPRKNADGSYDLAGSRDLLKTLPLNTSTKFELSDSETVVITALDANHCPGAIMYLIEGRRGAVLHTGDFRAEPWFLEALTKNPLVQPYLAPPVAQNQNCPTSTRSSGIVRTLEAIYLDTACMFGTSEVPTKDAATSGLVSLMAMLPESTHFFINAWTLGYEDVLKAVARAFGSQIHVDRYKYQQYSHISGDPMMRCIITEDTTSTRFHACERFARCEHISVDESVARGNPAITGLSVNSQGKHVVYVNPVTMGVSGFELYMKETVEKLQQGEVLNHLLVPLSRHSPLPELQAFVRLFKPKTVVPNTLDPALKGLDWACLPKMFAGCLSSSTSSHVPLTPQTEVPSTDLREMAKTLLVDEEDVTLKNLEGLGALEFVERWAEAGKAKRRLHIMQDYLEGAELRVIERILYSEKSSPSRRYTKRVAQDVSVPKPAIQPPGAVFVPAAMALASPSVPQLTPNATIKEILTRKAHQGIVGRASMQEESAAKARMMHHTSDFDSDTDKDDPDEDMLRAITHHMIMAPAAGLDPMRNPFGIFDIPSSSAASSPARTSVVVPEPVSSLKVDVASWAAGVSNDPENPSGGFPLTPTSRNGSQEIMWPISPSPRGAGPSIQRTAVGSSQFVDVLGSPILLSLTHKHSSPSIVRTAAMLIPDPTARLPPHCMIKQTVHSIPHSSPHKLYEDNQKILIPPSTRDSPSSPLTDMRNPTKHHDITVLEQAIQRASVKRRRVDQCPGQLSNKRPSSNTDLKRRSAFGSRQSSVIKPNSSSKTGLSHEEKERRHAAKLQQRSIVERLRFARPDLASRTQSSAAIDLRTARPARDGQPHSPQQRTPTCPDSDEVVPDSQDPGLGMSFVTVNSTPRRGRGGGQKLLSQLSSQDDRPGIDTERTAQLAERFRREIASGRRPGLVIPRMACLESQEERPPV